MISIKYTYDILPPVDIELDRHQLPYQIIEGQ